ncbi:MAG: hypothetical protein HN353_09520 [Bdellovibrionales bacterium]|jgi:hypothetical protein|nr:hypothetical protein [Bdellovibrionales bacterium]MBT3525619.1 hypothetical protein [Bdellovibrionales bacterium]MBT7668980.1 hypothetical protein [Bdellovibrionales bacterium]MBT7766709.1 hypothetical protein [Bdellovibrionales bacterium]
MDIFQQNERNRLNLTESCLRCGTAVDSGQPCNSCITRLKEQLGELTNERSYYSLKNLRAHKGIVVLSRSPWLELSGISSREYLRRLKVRLRHLVNYLSLYSGEVEPIYMSEAKHILTELADLGESSTSLMVMLEPMEEGVLYQHLVTRILSEEKRLASQQFGVDNFFSYKIGGMLTIRHMLLIITLFAAILSFQHYLFRINGLI